ncbi:phage tail tape measure protein [Anaeroarcus burkinensis]|uniref:phage tail tape measure protein n=1 Tax=Anaeroarcus burkinensis TaxID=82376 RepID=UPI00040F04A8|nr:phage tail tape measure protein [Anaeroarcus burkinensis]
MARVIDAVLSLKDKFSPTLRAVSRTMEQQSAVHKRLSKDIQETGNAISNFGKATAFISAPLVGAAAAGFQLSQSLDKSMARVGMLGDLTKVQTAAMKKQIVDLSNATGVASETIADAMQKAIVAGVPAGDSMKYLGDCIKYSKVSAMELSQTVETTNAYLKAYNMTADQASGIHDKMVMTAKLAKVEMAVMSPALAMVAKSAADAGVSVEQMDAAYVLMVKHGMDNSAAAASLSGLFESFTKASPKAIKAAQEYGIELNRAHIQAVGFPAFLREIQEKTGGNEVAMGKIIKDVKAFKLALQMTGNEGEFNEMLEKIRGSTGITAKALEDIKTPSGETIKAMNQIQNAGIELVDGLEPLLTRSADMIKKLVGSFNSLSAEQKNMIFTAAKYIILTTIMSGTIGKTVSVAGKGMEMFTKLAGEYRKAGSLISFLTTKFSGLVKAFQIVGTAARFLFMTPLGFAIVAVVALVYLLYRYWGPVSAFFINLWGNIKAAFNAGAAAVNSVLNVLGAYFGILKTVAGNYLNGWLNIISAVIDGATTVFHGLIMFITGVFSGNWAAAWQGVVTIFTGIFGTIEGICNAVMTAIKSSINAVIGGINNINVDIPAWVPVVGGQHFQPSIPLLAKGTDNWQGGPAMIHDAGPEIVDLPSGTRVIPHDKSMQQEYQRGRNDGGQSFNLEKLADTLIVREDADIDKIVQQLAFKLKAYAINMAEGAV